MARKRQKDDYGAWILEEYTVTDWTVHLPSANKVRHCYATDKIPAKFDYNDGNGEIDLVVPDDAVVRTHDENGIRFKRRIHSEDYNASLKINILQEKIGMNGILLDYLDKFNDKESKNRR